MLGVGNFRIRTGSPCQPPRQHEKQPRVGQGAHRMPLAGIEGHKRLRLAFHGFLGALDRYSAGGDLEHARSRT
jgi:hypothetical protein